MQGKAAKDRVNLYDLKSVGGVWYTTFHQQTNCLTDKSDESSIHPPPVSGYSFKGSKTNALTRVELFDDEFYLSVHIWLIFFDKTS